MSVWFTSDEHYGHRNILRFCNRPFADLDAMTEGLIQRHNSVVKPGDLVYHLGDMFWRTFPVQMAEKVLDSLNGQHYYIRGNHEELIDRHESIRKRFVWIRERTRINPEGGPKAGIVLDHFAGMVWDKRDKGSWQLYGHSHGDLPGLYCLLSLDVGVDANGYYPLSLEQVRKGMESKTWPGESDPFLDAKFLERVRMSLVEKQSKPFKESQ